MESLRGLDLLKDFWLSVIWDGTTGRAFKIRKKIRNLFQQWQK